MPSKGKPAFAQKKKPDEAKSSRQDFINNLVDFKKNLNDTIPKHDRFAAAYHNGQFITITDPNEKLPEDAQIYQYYSVNHTCSMMNAIPAADNDYTLFLIQNQMAAVVREVGPYCSLGVYKVGLFNNLQMNNIKVQMDVKIHNQYEGTPVGQEESIDLVVNDVPVIFDTGTSMRKNKVFSTHKFTASLLSKSLIVVNVYQLNDKIVNISYQSETRTLMDTFAPVLKDTGTFKPELRAFIEKLIIDYPNRHLSVYKDIIARHYNAKPGEFMVRYRDFDIPAQHDMLIERPDGNIILNFNKRFIGKNVPQTSLSPLGDAGFAAVDVRIDHPEVSYCKGFVNIR